MNTKLVLSLLTLGLCLGCSKSNEHMDAFVYHHLDSQKVSDVYYANVSVYYESLCPGCMLEFSQFPPVVAKLGEHVHFHIYPFGNAKLIEKDGKKTVVCQHGEKECYGNKLHACAVEILQEQQAYIDFNACLMAGHSDDAAADSCGKKLNVDVKPIKSCAGSARGENLLIYYGEESKKIEYHYVPYVLVNDERLEPGADLFKAVCESFEKAKVKPIPEACKKH